MTMTYTAQLLLRANIRVDVFCIHYYYDVYNII